MPTGALNRIIKEVNALTPHERRELIDRLTHEEQKRQEQTVRKPGTLKGTVKYMAADFDAPVSFIPNEEEITTNGTTLRECLNGARKMRAELPVTSDSVDILRELREVRSTK